MAQQQLAREKPATSSPHILVIEDQEDLAALYEATLKDAGYRVSNAYSGEEGIAEYEAEGADAIILDMTLPEMNGVQTLEKLRQRSASLPVIVVTGETNDELRARCERLGVLGYLTKPPRYDEIIQAISHAIENKVTRDFEVVTMRLPRFIIESLKATDTQVERAIIRWHEERAALHNPTSTSPGDTAPPTEIVVNKDAIAHTAATNDKGKRPAHRSLLAMFKKRFRTRR